jgi:hypothetical protein
VRPKFNQQTTPDDFLSFYWLKAELIGFLREHDLSTTGSKQELTARISQFLETGTPSLKVENKGSQKSTRRAEEMPKIFTRQSVIGPGWRCSQELRAFFEQEIGSHFHFDGTMRDFIRAGAGKTLQEAVGTWEAERRKPVQEKSIQPQFEYNRHIREYFKAHPGATLQEAIRDWKVKKKERRNRNDK